MNLDDTFCFKLGFDKKKDEKGRVYYKKTYGAGAYALVTALEGQDDIADDAFHVAYHNEPLNVLMENDSFHSVSMKQYQIPYYTKNYKSPRKTGIINMASRTYLLS